MSFSLEGLLTHPEAFALTTASPLQRAICRVADGLPLGDHLATHPDVAAAMGDVSSLTPGIRPAELLILSGVRVGKSLLAAALAVRAALTCDLSGIRPGEPVRVSVVSLTVDLARVVFDHIVGTLVHKPALRKLLVNSPTADSVDVMHPSGHVVEIKVVAGSRAGSSLVARWSAGVIFDEAPRMNGEEDGVVNFDDARRAALGRLLPGAQLVAIGSPWAPRGPVYQMVQEHWQKPSARLVVVRAPAPAMNPNWWTPDRVDKLRQQDEQAYRTDVLGEFSDPESSLFSSGELDRCTRTGGPLVLEREPRHDYRAAMDPGTRGNAWTLAIATLRRVGGKDISTIVLAKQWQGSKTDPLNPDTVLKDIAADCLRYGLDSVTTDQWSADALRAIADRHKLYLHIETITAPRKVELYESLRARLADGALELPPDPQVRADLLSLRKRVTTNGISIELPRTADGRHADYAPAIALAVEKYLSPPTDAPPVLTGQAWCEELLIREANRVADQKNNSFGFHYGSEGMRPAESRSFYALRKF